MVRRLALQLVRRTTRWIDNVGWKLTGLPPDDIDQEEPLHGRDGPEGGDGHV